MIEASKIVLGTVQFGCQYGINSIGKPSMDEVSRILNRALEVGITKLDTSSAYGDAEVILGKCISANACFNIISKYPKCEVSVRDMCVKSMNNLRVDKLYGYLLHHFELFLNNNSIWNDFRKLRRDGLVQKIGFSLYSESELDLLLENNIDFDIIQVPRNILDRKFDPYLPILREKGVEVHVRSTFLQGLFFKNRECLPQKLQPIKDYLKLIDLYSIKYNMSISELAMNYNLQNDAISGVLIGVDSVTQLNENLNISSNKNIDIDIKVREKELLNPINWK